MLRSTQYSLSYASEDFVLSDSDGQCCLSAKLTDAGAKVLHKFTYENNADHPPFLVKLMTEKICQFLTDEPKDTKLFVIPGAYASEFETPATETYESNPAIVYHIQAKLRSVQAHGLFPAKNIKADDEVLARLQEFRNRIIPRDFNHYYDKSNNHLVTCTEQHRCRSIARKLRLADSALRILFDDTASNDLISDEQWTALMLIVRKEKVVVEYLERCKQSLSRSTLDC